MVLCEVRTYTSGSSIGGIAGSNLGTIANSGIKDIESNSAVVVIQRLVLQEQMQTMLILAVLQE